MPEIIDKLVKLLSESLDKNFESYCVGEMIIVHYHFSGVNSLEGLPIAYIKLSEDNLDLLLFDRSCDWCEDTTLKFEAYPPPDEFADYNWSLGDPNFDPMLVVKEISKIGDRITPKHLRVRLSDLLGGLK